MTQVQINALMRQKREAQRRARELRRDQLQHLATIED